MPMVRTTVSVILFVSVLPEQLNIVWKQEVQEFYTALVRLPPAVLDP